MKHIIGLLATLLACSCYGGETEPPLGTQCSPGIGTLDPTPGDCVVIRDNPLVPECPYRVTFHNRDVAIPGDCAWLVADGSRVYLADAEVTYGPLAPGEECSCAYVSRSR